MSEPAAAPAFNAANDWDMADWARQAVAWGSVPAHLPDDSVRLVAVFQTVCDLPRCKWASGCLPDEQAVTEDAQRHLDRHRAALAWARGDTP